MKINHYAVYELIETENKKMTDKPKITDWNLADGMGTPTALLYYLEAALEENDNEFTIIACKEVVEIAKAKGWIRTTETKQGDK